MSRVRGHTIGNESSRRLACCVVIVLVSTSIAIGFSWRVTDLDSAARDLIPRMHGATCPSPEIVIGAIDESSIRRLGRFPWPREYMARALERISAARPKVIALDVLYSEPTTPGNDEALVTAIKQAGNVVAAAQLAKTTDDKGEGQ